MLSLILASASPRRRDLMRRMGLVFETVVSHAEQEGLPYKDPGEYALAQARLKAYDVASRRPGAAVVAADTVVYIDGMILGKPQDEDDAKRMLHLLSNKTHTVFTALAVLIGGRAQERVSSAQVTFARLSMEEIGYYVSTGEPMDKAGAYGIQDIGMRYIERISGDYYTVCGLPVRLLYEILSLEGNIVDSS